MLKQVQMTSSVPRTLGVDVKFVCSGGKVQVGVKENNGMAEGMHFAGTVPERDDGRSNYCGIAMTGRR
jgi:hypothetical protein